MADGEQTLTKGRRAACGHLVAKGRKVHDDRCFDCAAVVARAMVRGEQRAVVFGPSTVARTATAGQLTVTLPSIIPGQIISVSGPPGMVISNPPTEIHWRFGRA